MTVTTLPTSTGELFDDTPATDLSVDQLGARLTGYAGQIAALTARFLELLAEFDTRRGWSGHGILSCAHWLCWRTGMSLRTAHEHVRVAHALTTLPRLRTAFGRGELTYSKIRALTRVATPEREAELLHIATSATAAQVERLVRAMRTLDHGSVTGRDSAGPGNTDVDSTGRWRWNHDGTLSVSLKLNPLDGAAFLAAAVRAEYERTRTSRDPDLPPNALRPDTASATHAASSSKTCAAQRNLWRHVPVEIAPAVRVMADTLRTTRNIPGLVPTADVVVHTHHHTGTAATSDIERSPDDAATPGPVSADSLPADPHLDDGPALTEGEAAEIICGGATTSTTHRDGVRLWWGRRRRNPTRKLMQFVTQRDRTCRHPGCSRVRYLHIHHVAAWTAGGTTDPDNLILLCGEHHRAVHRNAFAIRAHGRQRFSFHTPDGTLIDNAPPLAAPAGWRPDTSIPAGATVPVNGGTLDLGYTIDVLHRTWELHRSGARGEAA